MKRPTVNDQVKQAGAPAQSALAKMIRANQDFELLQPEELEDEFPIPPWLRVAWRKQHPEVQLPAKNPGAAYPEVLSQVYERMQANPNDDWATVSSPEDAEKVDGQDG
jgi:hypothetical protein